MHISIYPLFTDAYVGIYPHATLQYHPRPKAKRHIPMLSVDKFPDPRKRTRGNEFIQMRICVAVKSRVRQSLFYSSVLEIHY